MTLSLKCHPDFPAHAISAVEAEVILDASRRLTINYSVLGDIGSLQLLDKALPKRTDYLWQKTCFEAFIGAIGQKQYLEMNLSPSTEWAMYSFDDHRRGMSNPGLLNEPKIRTFEGKESYHLSAEIDLRQLPGLETDKLELSLTAVIEEKDGQKSLWALAHPSGNPDFHHRDCFVHHFEGDALQ